jgi:hypothetical protein
MMNESVEEPWVLNEVFEKQGELDPREFHCDETLTEVDRRREAEHLRALGRRREILKK